MQLTREQLMIGARRAYYLGSARLSRTRLAGGYALPALQAIIEPTYRCNLRCSMCPFLPTLESPDAGRPQREELSAEEIIGVVRSLPRFSVVTLTGGEPTIRGDFLPLFAEISRRNKSSFVTNGTLMDMDLARELLKLRPTTMLNRGFFLLFFSVHGPEAVHDEITQVPGAFRRATDGVRLLQQEKRRLGSKYPLISFNCVITRENHEHLDQVFALAEELEVDFCNFSLRTYNALPDQYGHHRMDFDEAMATGYRPSAGRDEAPLDRAVMAEQLTAVQARAASSPVQLHFLPRGLEPEEILDYYCGDTDELREPEQSLGQFGCYSPWWRFLLTAHGDVTSCPNVTMGNIRDNSLAEIWNNPKQRRFRKVLSEGMPPFCSRCDMSEK